MRGGRAFARAASGAGGRVLVTAVVVAAVVLGMTSAAWACHPLLSGATRCSVSGDQVVTWSIGNSERSQSMSITAVSARVGATSYAVDGYSNVVAKNASTTATTTVPGPVTGTIVLTVTGAWRHRVTATRHASVDLGGTCAPPTTTTTTTTTAPPPTTTTTVLATTTTTSEPPATTTTTEPPVTTTTETPTTVVVKTVTTVAPTTSTTASPTTTTPTVHTQGSTMPPTASATPPKPGGTLPWTGSSGVPLWIALGSIIFGLTAFLLQWIKISVSIRSPRR